MTETKTVILELEADPASSLETLKAARLQLEERLRSLPEVAEVDSVDNRPMDGSVWGVVVEITPYVAQAGMALSAIAALLKGIRESVTEIKLWRGVVIKIGGTRMTLSDIEG